MKRIVFLVVIALSLAACTKEEMSLDKIIGTWGECYDSGKYALGLTDKNTITLNPDKSDDSRVTYTIVKLTSGEMAWQKAGTTYSEGTWGSDYRHFVRIR